MYNIAKLTDKDRNILFSTYAQQNGKNIAIIEKDFWVTLMLDYLFHESEYKDYFIFKGGTSLSKCFGIIDRFSEDIDLILRWDILTDDNPNKQRSKNKQDKYNKLMNKLTADFIKNKLLPSMIKDFKIILGREPIFLIDENDSQVMNFNYPHFSNSNETRILDHIRLEIGPLAALTPTEDVSISPQISDTRVFSLSKKNTIIKTVSPERTFWEKILILHQEADRSDDKQVPLRYSRHYYDIYKISLTKYKKIAYENLKLLEQVREFKKKFYPVAWAKYDLAKPGTFNLIPSEKHRAELSKDFSMMKEMINDTSLSNFDDLLKEIEKIQTEINKLE